MTCNFCKRNFNYCFYIDDRHWKEVVGEEWFKKNQGHICAHCTLEKVGGADWYIIHAEPLQNIRENIENSS